MNRKMIIHGLMITAIVIATFAVAALTPVKTYAKTSETVTVKNIAKVDFENRTLHKETKMIADNEIPLAATPSENGINMKMWWIIVSVSAVITGIVIIEERKDKKI